MHTVPNTYPSQPTAATNGPKGPTPIGAPAPRPAEPGGVPITPLWAVLLFTFLNSCGSAIVYSGLFFIAKNQYGFDDTQRFWLGLLFGAAYVPAAFFVGPALRAVQRRGVSPRGLLVALMVGMSLACALPWLAARFGSVSAWPLWTAVAIYSPLSGALWANVESFLAGGRSGRGLRSATGKFNITWSSSIVITLVVIAPAVEKHSLVVLFALAGLHLACAGQLLITFQRRPGEHAHEDHSSAPAVFARLLGVCRLLLPASFMLMSAMSPVLPTILTNLKVPKDRELFIAAVWPTARLGVFFLMERWHGWHGRWWPVVMGGVLLLVSFAGIVVGPVVLPGVGMGVLLASLMAFGVGMGAIYCAALYYAMEVSDSGVDAGGVHEAMIGVGYSMGPLCGIGAASLVSMGAIHAASRDVWMIGLAALLAVGVAVAAIRRARTSGTRGAGRLTENPGRSV